RAPAPKPGTRPVGPRAPPGGLPARPERQEPDRGSMAARRASIGEGADRGDEPPVVARRPEGQRDDSEGRRVAYLAARLRRARAVVRSPARADDELADALRTVERARDVQRREALVVVVVADEDDVRTVVVERVPEPRDLLVVPV